MPPRLSPDVLGGPAAPALPYDRTAVTAGVVHLGLGAFARAHVARYCEDLILAGDDRSGVLGVSLRSGTTTSALAAQAGLYTLTETDGQTSADRVVAAVTETAHGGLAAVKAIARPATRVVTLTVTEKGYHAAPGSGLDTTDPDIAADLAGPGTPTTTPAVLVDGLRRRRERGLGAVPVVSCDNLDGNGAVTAAVVVDFARRVDPSLAAWIAAEVPFPSTVVDRIVPATSDDHRRALSARCGYDDAAPVVAETYCSWVIERCDGLPAWDRVGAIVTDDVTPWQRHKLRAINGPHSTLAYLGGLAGYPTIDAAAADPDLARFVEAMVRLDVWPTLTGLGDGGQDATAVLRRFANPALGHRCSQVASDGSRKLRQRLGDVIADRRATGVRFDRLALAAAGWMVWVAAAAQGRHRLDDPDASTLSATVHAAAGDRRRLVEMLMGTSGVFPAAIATDDVVRDTVTRALRRIDEVGPVAAARMAT